MKNYNRLLTLLLAVVIAFCSATPAFAEDTTTSTDSIDETQAEFYEGFDLFEYLYEYLLKYHVNQPDGEDVLLKTIQKMIDENPELLNVFIAALMNSEDPYSHYFTEDEFAAYKARYDYYGIGVTVEYDDGYVKVTAVNNNSSAQFEGVEVGDIIYKVDGKLVAGIDKNEIIAMLRGDEGTNVDVSFYRESDKKVYNFTLKRKALSETPVQWYIDTDENGVKYAVCKIKNFSSYSSYYYFTLFLNDIVESNVGRIVIDLRDNPGGSVNAALDTINWLIPGSNRAICTAVYADSINNTTYRTTGRGIEFGNVALLVNKDTASAAELMAKSLQEYGIAKVFGAQTYGKAVGQYQSKQADGSVISLTMFEILSPKGHKYNGIGVIPDVTVDAPYVEPPTPVTYSPLNHGNFMQAALYTANDVNYALEQRLVLLGYLDKADSYFDKDTAQAIWDFQENMGIKPTATFNLETFTTMTDLVNLVKLIGTNVDPQLDAAVNYVTHD